ncbi:MAG: GNAT family N-acetyltransferase [Acidobacteria bacterium]|jgi:GNAT superfamily N-acetyltransferase|nr:GNAT family N-acetyltransferase [Acidobacteriota bacterium]
MLTIRPATARDVPVLRELILALAEYERLAHTVVVTEEELLRDGFGPQPKFRALLAEYDGQNAGYALFYEFYSTFEGRTGLFLEDLFVRPGFRGQGMGKALLARLSALAVQEDRFAVRWDVLDWNTPAIEFYQSLGGRFRDSWKTVSLEGEALRTLGSSQPA